MELRIGSFNVRNMGYATKKDYDKLAEIIQSEKMDIVSLQEILGDDKGLKMNLMYLLPGWEVFFGRAGSSKYHDKREEGYAFIWNAKKLTFSKRLSLTGREEFEPRIVGTSGDGLHAKGASDMIRPPLYGRFKPVNGGILGGFFEIRLVNVHLYYGSNDLDDIKKRHKEFEILVNSVFPAVSKQRFGDYRPSYTIIMGDYNLNLYKYRGEAEKRINKNTYIPVLPQGDQEIITVQDGLTTLKNPKDSNEESRGYSQNFDHFSYSVKELEDRGASCKYRRIDAVRKYYNDDFDLYRSEISDHVPIVFTLTV